MRRLSRIWTCWALGARFGPPVVLAILGLVLHFSGAIGHHMSMTLRTIMTRLMGMILAAIAVGMLAAGLKDLLPGLAG